MSSDLDKAVESFRRESRQKEPIYPPQASCLRRTGLGAGAAAGLAYGLSHLIYLLNSADASLYPPAPLRWPGSCCPASWEERCSVWPAPGPRAR